MSLLTQVRALEDRLRSLDEAASALQTTLCEDRPLGEPPALVDAFENAVLDLLSDCQEALQCLRLTVSWLDAGVAIRDVRDELVKVHTLMARLEEHYWSRLASYKPLAQLLTMGGERGPQWRGWSRVVEAAIGDCGVGIAGAERVLINCWSELCERLLPAAGARAGSLTERVIAGEWVPQASESRDATSNGRAV